MGIIGVGSDAEFFVTNSAGEVVSAIGKLGGTKRKPRITEHGAVQEDGVLAELNTIPAYTSIDFVKNFRSAQEDMENILKEQGLSSLTRASFKMDPIHLKHPLARRAGCSQDFCSWNMQLNDRPSFKRNQLRTASAHIHISWPEALVKEDINRQFKTASAMDLFHSVAGILYDEDVERRQLYGKAGSCRLKEYGVECRTSSNWWTKEDRWIEWTFNQAVKSVNSWDDEKITRNAFRIQRSINEYDKDLAKSLLREFKVEMP